MLLVETESPPESCHIAVVLGESGGKAVVGIAIANKIKELRAVGVQRGSECAFAGVGDWPGWQPGKTVRVIGRVHGEVGVMQASLVGALEQFGVDHAGIRVECHA